MALSIGPGWTIGPGWLLEGGPPAGDAKGNPTHNSDGATRPETHFIGETWRTKRQEDLGVALSSSQNEEMTSLAKLNRPRSPTWTPRGPKPQDG